MFNSKTQRNILIVIILILICGFGYGYNKVKNLEVDLNISTQNNKALADSVRITKNKYGEIVASKNSLVSDKKDLADLNSALGEELKREKGRVRQLNRIVATIGTDKDTVEVKNTLIKNPDGTFGLNFIYDKVFDEDNSRHIAGISNFRFDGDNIVPLSTILTKDMMRIKLITGLKETKDGGLEIFVKSKYPNFVVNELDGALIDVDKLAKKYTKKTKWSVGAHSGYGFQFNNGGGVTHGVQAGFGIQYTLFRF